MTLCCERGALCIADACVHPGADCRADAECPEGSLCEPVLGKCLPVPDDAACRFVPTPGQFEPVVQWHHGEHGSSSLPLVAQLTDDDGDGRIDAGDVPDLVIAGYPPAMSSSPRVFALSGDDGQPLFEAEGGRPESPHLIGAMAVADLDADGTVEIIVGNSDVYVYDHTGAVEWNAGLPHGLSGQAVAVGDLDGDGSAEILFGGALISASGDVLWEKPELAAMAGPADHALVDLDGDGDLEIAAYRSAFHHDGSPLWQRDSQPVATMVAHVLPAHPGPQLVWVGASTVEIASGATGQTLWGPVTYAPVDLLAGDLFSAMVGDFDGDGTPEIGINGQARFTVIDPALPAPHALWSVAGVPGSTAGATIFDFDADGAVEVVYTDGCHLQILAGRDGSQLWHTSQTTSGFNQPVVADVDGDGNAELVVTSTDINLFTATKPNCQGRPLAFTGNTQGVFVYRDMLDNWVPTRPVWNQLGYHMDNVRDDGSVPAHETPSWTTHNSYRVNRLLDAGAVTLAPDLRVTRLAVGDSACPLEITLRAEVSNAGARGVPAGVRVAFRSDEGRLLGVGETTQALVPGQAQWVEIVARDVAVDADKRFAYTAEADDDGQAIGAHSECHEDNNRSAAVTVDCSGPQ